MTTRRFPPVSGLTGRGENCARSLGELVTTRGPSPVSGLTDRGGSSTRSLVGLVKTPPTSPRRPPLSLELEFSPPSRSFPCRATFSCDLEILDRLSSPSLFDNAAPVLPPRSQKRSCLNEDDTPGASDAIQSMSSEVAVNLLILSRCRLLLNRVAKTLRCGPTTILSRPKMSATGMAAGSL